MGSTNSAGKKDRRPECILCIVKEAVGAAILIAVPSASVLSDLLNAKSRTESR